MAKGWFVVVVGIVVVGLSEAVVACQGLEPMMPREH